MKLSRTWHFLDLERLDILYPEVSLISHIFFSYRNQPAGCFVHYDSRILVTVFHHFFFYVFVGFLFPPPPTYFSSANKTLRFACLFIKWYKLYWKTVYYFLPVFFLLAQLTNCIRIEFIFCYVSSSRWNLLSKRMSMYNIPFAWSK